MNSLRLYLDRNFKKMCECADMLTQLACFLRHPTCFISTIKNETINSPPCRKICLSNRCNGLLIDFVKIYESLYKLCPDKFDNPIKFSNTYRCVNFPKQDMNNIVGCQLIRKFFFYAFLSFFSLLPSQEMETTLIEYFFF